MSLESKHCRVCSYEVFQYHSIVVVVYRSLCIVAHTASCMAKQSAWGNICRPKAIRCGRASPVPPLLRPQVPVRKAPEPTAAQRRGKPPLPPEASKKRSAREPRGEDHTDGLDYRTTTPQEVLE